MGHDKKMNDKIGQENAQRRGREKGIGRCVCVLYAPRTKKEKRKQEENIGRAEKREKYIYK
jgi:hypothetical protein